MFAAVGAGIHATVADAQSAMLPPPFSTHHPDPQHATTYDRLYSEYLTCHDAFGGVDSAVSLLDLAAVMKNLIAIRDTTRAGHDADVR